MIDSVVVFAKAGAAKPVVGFWNQRSITVTIYICITALTVG